MTGPPVLSIRALVDPEAGPADREAVGAEIVAACERYGLFQVVDHGVPIGLRADLHEQAQEFFRLPPAEKARVSMELGGRAWRGWFGLGEELTAGVPDRKEGMYFGTELGPDDARVRAGLPLHGPNLFPDVPAGLRPAVLSWIQAVASVGQALLEGMARGLGLEPRWFDRWCADPTVLFRIFHYPPPIGTDPTAWGVAEHTDYGLLTLLAQDRTGGLQAKVEGRWLDIPYVDDAFVCNLGDMAERMTGGRFRSTPHRVRPQTEDRYSFPLFLDPGWDAVIHPVPGQFSAAPSPQAAHDRWDGTSVLDGTGPYGDYLMAKVSKVFPDLFGSCVGDVDHDPAG